MNRHEVEKETRKHIDQVRQLIDRTCLILKDRAICHDQSKLKPPELEIFEIYTEKLKNTTYGSDEYKQFLKEMKSALEHHYACNRHHPEHFKKYNCNGCHADYKGAAPGKCKFCGYTQFQEEPDISQMNLFDIVEMFCDWFAATQRHADGDIMEGIAFNKIRFKYGTTLEAILINTANAFMDK